jgi:hypothetical protein
MLVLVLGSSMGTTVHVMPRFPFFLEHMITPAGSAVSQQGGVL